MSHTVPPVYDVNSQILILGSFPSVKSREMNFYYGYPQNRFWKVLAQILGVPVPQTIAEKQTGKQAVKLPSTSPANAAWSLERLCKEWGEKIRNRFE